MNIRLLAIGKTDNKALQSLIDDYQKRLSFYIKFDIEIIPDIKNVKHLSEAQQKEKEGELIMDAFDTLLSEKTKIVTVNHISNALE